METRQDCVLSQLNLRRKDLCSPSNLAYRASSIPREGARNESEMQSTGKWPRKLYLAVWITQRIVPSSKLTR